MRFPKLKTGALAQYPAVRRTEFANDILRFIDGSEQRCRLRKRAAKRWVVRLELLDETELARLASFFRATAGRKGTFEFVDPWTGEVFENCSLAIDELEMEAAGEMRSGTVLTVQENV